MKNTKLVTELSKHIPRTQISEREIDRFALAGDASFYRMIPQLIVKPNTEKEVQHLLSVATSFGIPVTFRAAGTSLSGQSVTDGILAVLSSSWKRIAVMDDGKVVHAQPGAIGSHVNRALKPYGRKIGPDPASINSCMMGGIVANNSSGMCCGVEQNSYKTLDSLRFVLPNGCEYDSALPRDRLRFLRENPLLAAGLLEMKHRIFDTPALLERVVRKYSMKNTVGYSLNAFVDFDHPMDIFTHLLVGSEGTLAFIADIRLHTVPDPPYKSTGLLWFATLREACNAIPLLRYLGVAAAELMDTASLRCIPYPEAYLFPSLIDGVTAVLVEHQAESHELLLTKTNELLKNASAMNMIVPATLSSDDTARYRYWKVRKGLFPIVGAKRPANTSLINEDVAFPLDVLAVGISELQHLFSRYKYNDGIIFGHALEGNLHFVIAEHFNSPAAVVEYDKFMHDLSSLVSVRHRGSLKAEHGTGRNIAPFVEREWGTELYSIMKAVKRLADPNGVLSPGVVISDNPKAHITNLKTLPEVQPEVQQCIECGYCESYCPSKDVTVTPRQRIALTRAIASCELNPRLRANKKDLQYNVIDTCATDGMCSIACPVGINTGDLVKTLRGNSNGWLSNNVANSLARFFGVVQPLASLSIRLGHVMGAIIGYKRYSTLLTFFETIFRIKIPKITSSVGKPAVVKAQRTTQDAWVYFPSCATRVTGTPSAANGKSLPAAVLSLASKTGTAIRVPSQVRALCCGNVFSSKGYNEAQHIVAEKTIETLFTLSDNGAIPIVMDTTSCTYALRTYTPRDKTIQEKYTALQFVDIIEFTDRVTEHAPVSVRRRAQVTLHPVCSAEKLGLTSDMQRLAARFADSVYIPPSAGCCGSAGDRGLLYPELTDSATAAEVQEILQNGCTDVYASSLPCEAGLSHRLGFFVHSIVNLADESIEV